jgi:hypothetical protein
MLYSGVGNCAYHVDSFETERLRCDGNLRAGVEQLLARLRADDHGVRTVCATSIHTGINMKSGHMRTVFRCELPFHN